MSAIEVLKEWVNKPIIFDERFMTKEDYIEQVNLKVATQEVLLVLEQNDSLISDLLLLANLRADDTITGNEIISCLLKNKVNIVQGKDFIWERVGEQK